LISIQVARPTCANSGWSWLFVAPQVGSLGFYLRHSGARSWWCSGLSPSAWRSVDTRIQMPTGLPFWLWSIALALDSGLAPRVRWLEGYFRRMRGQGQEATHGLIRCPGSHGQACAKNRLPCFQAGSFCIEPLLAPRVERRAPYSTPSFNRFQRTASLCPASRPCQDDRGTQHSRWLS